MVSFSRSAVSFSRRSFVQKLGLGMGAGLLAPLAKNLVSEAQGQATQRKIAMFWFACNGINPYWVFTPPEFAEDLTKVEGQQEVDLAKNTSLISSANYKLPPAFQPFEPFRNQVLMLEGLFAHPRKAEDGGHGLGYMALNCVPGLDPDHLIPGGITYDQHLAKTISADTPRRSVLIGISSFGDKDMKDNMFAEGPGKSVAAFQNPVLLFKDLFGDAMAQAGGVGTPSVKNRLLFDGLRYDIARLEGSFAGEEKQKLANYLKTLEDYEKSLAAIGSLSCSGGTAPTLGPSGDPVDVLESLNALASIAITCGMTNVMGVDIGCSDSHHYGPDLHKLLVGTPLENTEKTSLADVGHLEAPVYGPVITKTYQWMGGMVVQTLQALQALPSGSGTLADNCVAMLSSDNGESHHSGHDHWPLFLVGKAGGLKLDGRYLRYPAAEERALMDVYSALGVGFGVPDTGFGVHEDGLGPNIRAQGPLPEMV